MWKNRLFALSIVLSPAGAAAQQGYVATPWQKAQSSEVRLLAPLPGPASADGWQYGAIEVRLPPDAKTYWRTAGETGVPPTFSFDGSANVTTPEALYPAPVSFDDGVGGVAYGYLGAAIFPIRFKPQGSYTLAVTFDYGVCLKTMCVPAQAKLTLAPAGAADGSLHGRVENALKQVPKQAGAGGADGLSVAAISAVADKDGLTLTVPVRHPEGASPRVFVEAGEAFAPVGAPKADGTATLYQFRAQRSAQASPWGEARITVATGQTAIETTANIDSAIKR